ncbi:LysR family transcriptional regulator [Asaia platycodi]|uniref:LysR family transcriptional regulator n=1 Tax=Asaia platycodi TaxID=610243 RepID=UPI000470C731|nr:LysR family transcriptional regulator [Asaia platycodi]
MDWDKLRIFHAVAEAGSFTHAGDRLNLSQSAVSRQISALEETLNVPLFHRHARGLILTEQGETLNHTVREVFSKLSLTQAYLSESKVKAKGELKITTTSGFGLGWLAPRLKRFLGLHPDIEVSLIMEDTDLDLGMREADVAIRMHPPRQADLIQRHLANFLMPIYSSQAYIDQHGMPTSIADLSQHHLVGFAGLSPPLPDAFWLLDLVRRQSHGSVRNKLEINSFPAIASAVANGAGIGSLPTYLAQAHPELVRILPHEPVPTVEAFFVYPEELKMSKRITVLRDFLLSEIQSSKL